MTEVPSVRHRRSSTGETPFQQRPDRRCISPGRTYDRRTTPISSSEFFVQSLQVDESKAFLDSSVLGPGAKVPVVLMIYVEVHLLGSLHIPLHFAN